MGNIAPVEGQYQLLWLLRRQIICLSKFNSEFYKSNTEDIFFFQVNLSLMAEQ